MTRHLALLAMMLASPALAERPATLHDLAAHGIASLVPGLVADRRAAWR